MKIIRKVELKQAELFYLEQGGLEYETPQGKTAFTAGFICPGQRTGTGQLPPSFIFLTRC